MMKRIGLYSEHAVEINFSMLRWIFFIVSISIFIYMYDTHTMIFPIIDYIVLALFGLVYMSASNLIIVKSNTSTRVYWFATRSGVLFDYIAFLFLIELTGGVNSVLFPIAFLIILHAAVYWRMKGGMVSGILLAVGYAVICLGQGMGHDGGILIHYLFDVMLLVLVGFLGGLIISRERYLTDQSRHLQELVIMDPLTGLNNHRHFHEKIDGFLKEGVPFFLVMGDVDFFKQINDQHGHKTGDYVLQYIGTNIKNCLQPDIGTAFRYGGEEFSMIFLTDEQSFVDRTLYNLKQSFEQFPFSADIKVSMSFGIAYTGSGSFNTDELINRADRCLYEAKEKGRNRAVYDAG